MRVFEWLGSIMMIVALITFAQNPKKAISSIPEVLSTNARIENGHLVVRKTGNRKKGNADKERD